MGAHPGIRIGETLIFGVGACRGLSTFLRLRSYVLVQVNNQRLYELHAELCSTMANPKRLAILESLHDGERSVTDIAEATGTAITTVSQHLRLLRDKHVVVTRKEGQTVYYRLRDPRMVEACHLIRSVLVDGMKAHGDFLVELEPPRRRRKAS